jgi:transposase
MSDEYRRVEIITGTARRRRCSTQDKLRMIEETLLPRENISVVARWHVEVPNLLYRWRRLMTEIGSVAIENDDRVTGNKDVRKLEERVRELERLFGRKTMEVLILKEALAKSQSKRPTLLSASLPRDYLR